MIRFINVTLWAKHHISKWEQFVEDLMSIEDTEYSKWDEMMYLSDRLIGVYHCANEVWSKSVNLGIFSKMMLKKLL